MIETIVIAIISSGALSTVISAIITALGSRNGIKSKLKKIEKDSVRSQLLLLIAVYPDEIQEILTVGEYYFATLKADWYMTSLFSKWLKLKKINKPNWLTESEEKE